MFNLLPSSPRMLHLIHADYQEEQGNLLLAFVIRQEIERMDDDNYDGADDGGDGEGYGHGDGWGWGDGRGSGDGSSDNAGHGDGTGYGFGWSDGDGDGEGNGDGTGGDYV